MKARSKGECFELRTEHIEIYIDLMGVHSVGLTWPLDSSITYLYKIDFNYRCIYIESEKQNSHPYFLCYVFLVGFSVEDIESKDLFQTH